MTLAINLLLPVLIQILIVIGIVIFIHSIRSNVGLVPSYVLSAILMLTVQWLTDIGTSVILGHFFLLISSVVIFPGILIGLLIVYIIDGPQKARSLFYSMISGELAYILIIIFLFALNKLPDFITLDITWFRNHIFSTIAVIADFIVLTVIWGLIHNKKNEKIIFPKVYLVTTLVLVIDTIVFVIGAFLGSDNMFNILTGDILVRLVLGLFISPVITLYLLYETKIKGTKLKYEKVLGLFSDKSLHEQVKKSQKEIEELTNLKQELEDSQLRFKLAADATNAGLYDYDYQSKTAWWSPNLYNLLKLDQNKVKPSLDKFTKLINPNNTFFVTF